MARHRAVGHWRRSEQRRAPAALLTQGPRTPCGRPPATWGAGRGGPPAAAVPAATACPRRRPGRERVPSLR